MKKLREKTDQLIHTTEQKWNNLPIKQQRNMTTLFFTGYLFLTVCLVVQILLNASFEKQIPIGGHINTFPKPRESAATSRQKLPAPVKQKEHHEK